jgi:hypothetical protein
MIFEILDLSLGVPPAVGFEVTNDDIESPVASDVRLLQHLEGLAHAWRAPM